MFLSKHRNPLVWISVALWYLTVFTTGSSAVMLPRQTDGCDRDNPCDQGCCSRFGNCGFGPDFCGEDCVNNCDAVAECGQFARPGDERCPLNVCCSEFGFCGTTAEFCGGECQNNCGQPESPSCSETGGSSDAKTIGYYESWSYSREGCEWSPEDLNPKYLTHINFAFALIGDDHRLAAMNPYDRELYTRTIALKKQNPSLRVFLAVGGWAMSGPPFSNMARAEATRAVFIESVMNTLETYGFDGIDLDWEYPTAPDRGGDPADTANYVTLVRELRQAFGSDLKISVAIPASFWYLRHFDLEAMAEHVDWFNMMSYDIHGTWDGNSEFTEAVVQPHTNLTEINQGLQLIWRANVPPAQVVLGLGFYGRSFELEDPSCTEPKCPFAGGAEPGSCMRTSGVLSNAEIRTILDRTGAEPVLNREAGIKYISWDNNQWVSYDDVETLEMKKRFANGRCLGGTMIWAVDLDEPGLPTLRDLATKDSSLLNRPDLPGAAFVDLSVKATVNEQNRASLSMVLTDCDKIPMCPEGYKELTSAHGNWLTTEDETEACYNNNPPDRYRVLNRRALCVEEHIEVEGCSWVGSPLFCDGGCPEGSVQLAVNNAPPIGMLLIPEMCAPDTWSTYCCETVRIPDPPRWCDAYDDGSMALAAGMGGGISPEGVADSSLQRLFLLLMLLEVTEDLPRRNFEECRLEKRGDPVGAFLEYFLLGVTGEEMEWELVEDYYPDDPEQDQPCTTTVTSSTTTTTSVTSTLSCDFDDTFQACHNYHSIARDMWVNNLNVAPCQNCLLCPFEKTSGNRHVPRWWDQQHRRWLPWVPQGQIDQGCQRDEYPFFRFSGAPNLPYQMMRLLPGWENMRVGQRVAGLCPLRQESSVSSTLLTTDSRICIDSIKTEKTQVVASVEYHNYDNAWDDVDLFDDFLGDNPCLPALNQNFEDRGFALLTQDPWYWGLPPPYDYRDNVPASLTVGVQLPTKRDQVFVPNLNEPLVIVEDRNSSRRATPEELDQLGIAQCRSSDCVEEFAALGLDKNGQSMLPSPEVVPTAEAGSSPSEGAKDYLGESSREGTAPQIGPGMTDSPGADTPMTAPGAQPTGKREWKA